jgi:hypothetical protein
MHKPLSKGRFGPKPVTPHRHTSGMAVTQIQEAVAWLEKANANLEPDLLTAEAARELLAEYARAENLVSYGRARLAARIDNASEVARATGTSIGKAKQTAETGAALADAPEVGNALARGDVSLDQAGEIAKAEQVSPGAAEELLSVAQSEAFHVLRDKARKVRLEAEQHRGLGDRQKEARSARSYSDELGMVNINLRLEPHVGIPIVNRAEADADRLYRTAKKQGETEPFERHLADAYAGMLCGKGKGRTTRPELVVFGQPRGRHAGLDRRQRRRSVQDPRRRAGCATGRKEDRRGCVSFRGVLRRQRPPPFPAVDAQHPGQGPYRLRARSTARIRRSPMC